MLGGDTRERRRDRERAEQQSRLRTDHIVAMGGDGGFMSGGLTQKLVLPAGGQSTRGEPLYTLAKHGAMGAATDRQLSR